MSTTAENWFREEIKSLVIIQAQLAGGYLDGTMMAGETEASLIKFPKIDLSKIEARQLSGAIEPVDASGADLTTVSVSPSDFEAAIWYRTQDLYKMGPSHKDALAKGVTMAIRNKSDSIKWAALGAFATAESISAIGGASTTIDPIYLEDARARISAAGMFLEGEVFCPLPARAMSQLIFYKEWADANFIGTADLPFSQRMRQATKTVRGVHYIEVPDAFFGLTPDAAADSFTTYMWCKYSMGAETPWNQSAPSMTQHTDKAGSPWLIKAGMGGAALGLQAKGLKVLTFDGALTPARPA